MLSAAAALASDDAPPAEVAPEDAAAEPVTTDCLPPPGVQNEGRAETCTASEASQNSTAGQAAEALSSHITNTSDIAIPRDNLQRIGLLLQQAQDCVARIEKPLP